MPNNTQAIYISLARTRLNSFKTLSYITNLRAGFRPLKFFLIIILHRWHCSIQALLSSSFQKNLMVQNLAKFKISDLFFLSKAWLRQLHRLREVEKVNELFKREKKDARIGLPN